MMCKEEMRNQSGKGGKRNNDDVSQNILRILTMLGKAVIRLTRRTYRARRQYPKIFFQIEEGLHRLRTWIQSYPVLFRCAVFQWFVAQKLDALAQFIAQLKEHCLPSGGNEKGRGDENKKTKGKKRGKGSRRIQSHRELCRAIDTMWEHLERVLKKSEAPQGIIGKAFEKAFHSAYDPRKQPPEQPVNVSGAQRGEHSCIFPWAQPEGYAELVSEKRRFKHDVVEKLEKYGHMSGHAASCPHSGRYILKGFRRDPRKPVMKGAEQETFPLRMVQCVDCGETFSLIPSFLAREKHFALDIIGHAARKLLLFGQSLSGTLEDLRFMVPGAHSKQTLLDWIAWIGTLHPATILTRAGIQGGGYFQEDEGFEKEPCLRTYTVMLVEPDTLLVWHADYVDHVDEETLSESFEAFVRQISFHVLGVTKDTWQPSTNALKRVLHALWIEFCHRHCLKKWRQALSTYQDETQCRATDVTRLYQKVKTVLDSAESSVVLKLKLRTLEREEPAFHHPILQARLDELKANAVRYTSHHKRNGLTKTTSIVDNFLKSVKRKLRQVESFRDQDCTRALFRAMATVRNFVPFLSGAKNAHNSPFMLAQGETYGLPWIQVMNMHNAFLFTEGAC
jgi:hypothetical protein